jgi:hypothetical protein
MEFRRPNLGQLGQAYRDRKRKGQDDEDERPPKHKGLNDVAEARQKKLQAMVYAIRTMRQMGLIDDVIWRVLEASISPDRNMIREAFRIADEPIVK